MRTAAFARVQAFFCATLILGLTSCIVDDDPSELTPLPYYPTGSNILSVTLSPQETQVWCWAATDEMVLGYYGYFVDQCEIVSAYYGYSNYECCYYPQYCQTTASTQTIQQVLYSYGGLTSTLYPSALTLDQVVTEIDQGRPMIAAYTNSFSGHVVVIYGYDSNGQLYIHDPYYGSFVVPYGSTFTYSGQLYWAQTIMGIGPAAYRMGEQD